MRIVAQTGATVLMVTHDVDEAVLLSDRVVMMTNGPAARIGEVLEVPLARPRERLALAHDSRFMDLRAAVLEFLYKKQAHRAVLKVA
jgi:nitrate/nitrite transport system ATP-binding protein